MSTSTKRTSASCKTRTRLSKTGTKSASFRRSQGDRMPVSKPKSAPIKRTSLDQEEKKRLWLMYPSKLITTPVIWQLGHKFKIVTNVRQASVTDEIGIVCREIDGKRSEIKSAIKWLESLGVSVEPIEINVIES